MDYPSYPPVIPNAFFAYPWYGYSGNSMCYGSGLQQATQQANIVYELDKILFPENPIRDYIQEEIRKIKEKYAERIKKLDALLE